MVARCAICMLVLSLLHIPWMLEQPASSVMELHPAVQHIAKVVKVFKVALVRLCILRSCEHIVCVLQSIPECSTSHNILLAPI